MLPKVKRAKYSAKFKLQVIKFVSDNAKNSAARRQFVVDENLVRDWRQKIEKSSFPRTKVPSTRIRILLNPQTFLSGYKNLLASTRIRIRIEFGVHTYPDLLLGPGLLYTILKYFTVLASAACEKN